MYVTIFRIPYGVHCNVHLESHVPFILDVNFESCVPLMPYMILKYMKNKTLKELKKIIVPVKGNLEFNCYFIKL